MPTALSSGSEWERSLASIISRTNANLNSLNERYGPPPVPPSQGSSHYAQKASSSMLPSYSTPASRYGPLTSGPVAGGGPGVQRHYYDQNAPPSHHPGPGPPPHSSASDLDASNPVDGSLLASIMSHVKRHLAAEAARSDAQLQSLSSTVSHLQTSVSKLVSDVEDLRRGARSTDTALDSLRHEVSKGRGVLQRLDGWVHDEEGWRVKVDTRLEHLQNESGRHSSQLQGHDAALQARPTNSDLSLSLSSCHLSAVSAVSAAMTPIQSHLEREIDGLRRHVVALRLAPAAADGGGGGNGALDPSGAPRSAFELERLDSRLAEAARPSDLLVKSVVGSEVAELAVRLDKSVAERIAEGLAAKMVEVNKDVKRLVLEEIDRSCKEGGAHHVLTADAVGQGLQEGERRARRALEEDLKAFMLKVDGAVGGGVDELKRKVADVERTVESRNRSIEKSIEETRSANEARAEEIRDKIRDMGRNVRDTEMAVTERGRVLGESLTLKVGEMISSCGGEIAEVGRRVKGVEDLLSNYAKNDERNSSLVRSFGKKIDVLEGMSKDMMKRVVETKDVEIRTLKVEGALDSIQERVGAVETKVSDLKRNSSDEIESNAGKMMLAMATVKEDIASFQRIIAHSKQESSTSLVSIASEIGDVKASSATILTRLDTQETATAFYREKMSELESELSRQIEEVRKSAANTVDQSKSRDSTKEIMNDVSRKTAALEDQIRMLSTSITDLEKHISDTKRELTKVSVTAEAASSIAAKASATADNSIAAAEAATAAATAASAKISAAAVTTSSFLGSSSSLSASFDSSPSVVSQPPRSVVKASGSDSKSSPASTSVGGSSGVSEEVVITSEPPAQSPSTTTVATVSGGETTTATTPAAVTTTVHESSGGGDVAPPTATKGSGSAANSASPVAKVSGGSSSAAVEDVVVDAPAPSFAAAPLEAAQAAPEESSSTPAKGKKVTLTVPDSSPEPAAAPAPPAPTAELPSLQVETANEDDDDYEDDDDFDVSIELSSEEEQEQEEESVDVSLSSTDGSRTPQSQASPSPRKEAGSAKKASPRERQSTKKANFAEEQPAAAVTTTTDALNTESSPPDSPNNNKSQYHTPGISTPGTPLSPGNNTSAESSFLADTNDSFANDTPTGLNRNSVLDSAAGSAAASASTPSRPARLSPTQSYSDIPELPSTPGSASGKSGVSDRPIPSPSPRPSVEVMLQARTTLSSDDDEEEESEDDYEHDDADVSTDMSGGDF